MDPHTLISSVQYLQRTIDPTYLYVVIGIPIDNFTQASTQFSEDGRCLAPLVPARNSRTSSVLPNTRLAKHLPVHMTSTHRGRGDAKKADHQQYAGGQKRLANQAPNEQRDGPGWSLLLFHQPKANDLWLQDDQIPRAETDH
jgi:hypothetical protein